MAPAFDPPLPAFPRDRYQVLELLGEGGMGRVFRARDRHLNRFVALKFLRKEDPRMARRLALEAQFQAGIEHPGILRVYEVGLLEDAPCIALQYVDGPDLGTLAPVLTLDERVVLLAQAARAIHAAHQQGLIHRDLKPQNILVETLANGQRQALVMDFGLARPVQDSELTLSQSLVGSPFYLSPELITGAGLDARSDVYSLGATLYALVIGRPPFAPTPEEGGLTGLPMESSGSGMEGAVEAMAVVETLRRVLDDDPVPPRRLRPEIPWDLETVILKCLEKDPARRYESAKALAEDLERVLVGEPIQARRGSMWYRVHKHYRRNRTLVLIAGLAITLLAGLGSWNVVRVARMRHGAAIGQRYTAEAEQLAHLLRLAHMSPLHDRGPQVAWIRRRMEVIRGELRRIGPLGQGAAHHALGQCHLTLDELDEALEHLDQAWQQGFRTPAAASALAETHLSLLHRELEKLRGPVDPGPPGTQTLDAATLALLQGRHREPALAYLRLAQEFPGMEAYRALELAFLENREEEALAFAEQALQDTPWMYEVLTLTSEIWRLRAGREKDPVGRRALLDRSLQDLNRAIALAPSDPTLRSSRANRLAEFLELASTPEARAERFAAGWKDAEAAQAIDPAQGAGLLSRLNLLFQDARLARDPAARDARLDEAACLIQAESARRPHSLDLVLHRLSLLQARMNAATGQKEVLKRLLDEALAVCGKALHEAPDHLDLSLYLLDFRVREGSLREELGEDPLPAYREALRLAQRADTRAQSPGAYTDLAASCQLMLGGAILDRGTYAEGREDIRQGLERLRRYQERTGRPSPYLENGIGACWILQELAFSGKGDVAEANALACAFLDAILRQWPAHASAVFERGRCDLYRARYLLAQGQDPRPTLAEAQQRIEASVRLAPAEIKPFGSRAQLCLLEALHLRRQSRPFAAKVRDGLKWCDRALAAYPDHHWATAYKGVLLMLQVEGRQGEAVLRQHREGRALLEKAVGLKPHLRVGFAEFMAK